ncbi:MAG TPA: CHAD domain-containing protein [Candidatus Acidoferrales bacterium]|nr:CHAD domain-containing protein [Candidatus Acidoferrales bacterium]
MALNEKRLEKSIKKLRKILKKRAKPLEPEDVHDLRTRSRRIETSIQATQPSTKHNERTLLRNLRRIRKRAGKVRDMDVLTSHVLNLQVKGEEECRTRLAEHLGNERYKQAEKLRRTIKRYGEKTRRQLKRTHRRFAREIEGASSNGQKLESAAAITALQQSADLASPLTLNRGNLHPYRMKVKELRYVLQAGEGEGDRKFVASLSETKDAIGEWHDWEELTSIAQDVLDHQPHCALIGELKRISREKYESAMSIVNKLRAGYLKAKRTAGQGKQRVYKHETTQPALKAVSSIAS